jgi:acyl carrier protein
MSMAAPTVVSDFIWARPLTRLAGSRARPRAILIRESCSTLCDAGHRSVGRNAVAILSRSEHPVQINRKGTHAMKTEIFDKVADIIAETSDIPRDTIKLESHAINDLGIDSLDFLDIAFAIDKAFGIKLPLEQWTQDVNDGKATTEQYFVLDNLCASIDGLVAAKMAKAA